MEITLKGDKKEIENLLRKDKTYMKRRGISVVSDAPQKEEPKETPISQAKKFFSKK